MRCWVYGCLAQLVWDVSSDTQTVRGGIKYVAAGNTWCLLEEKGDLALRTLKALSIQVFWGCIAESDGFHLRLLCDSHDQTIVWNFKAVDSLWWDAPLIPQVNLAIHSLLHLVHVEINKSCTATGLFWRTYCQVNLSEGVLVEPNVIAEFFLASALLQGLDQLVFVKQINYSVWGAIIDVACCEKIS